MRVIALKYSFAQFRKFQFLGLYTDDYYPSCLDTLRQACADGAVQCRGQNLSVGPAAVSIHGGRCRRSISVERKDCDENNASELGYMILTPWWSKGIGTEAVRQMCGIAFKELGIDCIEASVFEGNRASERVLEKNGFRLEETKTGAVVKGGKAMDVRVYMLV